MEPSPALRELTQRITEATGQGDVAFLQSHTAQGDAVAFLGTGPDEWWTDVESLSEALRGQQQAGIEVLPGEPIAYAAGDMGWAVDRGVRFRVGNEETPFRVSVVYHREDGAWKMVHFRCSVGVSNEDALGTELPTSS
jgi:hypothetical protein